MYHNLKMATEQDEEDFLRLAKDQVRKSSFSALKYDDEKARGVFKKYLEGDKTSLLILMTSDNTGFIIGLAEETLFSHDKIAGELGWSATSKADLLALFRAYEEWALRVGCKMISKGVIVNTKATSRFTKIEESYIRKV